MISKFIGPCVAFLIVCAACQVPKHAVGYSAPWQHLLLGAPHLSRAGTTAREITLLYGQESFKDENGNLWYRLNANHFRNFSFTNRGMTFVVFELSAGKMTNVAIVAVERILETPESLRRLPQ